MAVNSALFRKTLREVFNLRRLAREQSRFKVVFIGCFAAGCEAGLGYLFFDGFRWLDRLGGFGGLLVGRLFALFFLGLGIMLVVSSMVTAYTTMFRSRETEFLMAQPVSINAIVVYKFVHTAALSSWAYFLVIIPFVLAYALYTQASVLFAVWTFLFSLPFLVLCAGIGCALAMIWLRWIPRGRWRGLFWLLVISGGLAAWLTTGRDGAGSGSEVRFAVSRLVPGMLLASHPLMPSYWMAQGIMSLCGTQWGRGLMFGGVLLSSALMIVICVEWFGSKVFHDSWLRIQMGPTRSPRRAPLFKGLDRWLGVMRCDIRALVLKDLRTFVRDPMQWSQALVFFGLLALYFANLRSLKYGLLTPMWRNLMVFLNVSSVASVVCSLGSRFIYPQLSLEGQEFWLLGLAPTTMRRIILTKFCLALSGLVPVSVALAVLSAVKLGTTPAAVAVSAALAFSVACAVCGLSTGLGAVFLDLRQRNPAAIVSGFGGTLNLVLSLVFMLAAILPFAAIFQGYTLDRFTQPEFRSALLGASLWLAGITAVSTVVPLRLGIRALQTREF